VRAKLAKLTILLTAAGLPPKLLLGVEGSFVGRNGAWLGDILPRRRQSNKPPVHGAPDTPRLTPCPLCLRAVTEWQGDCIGRRRGLDFHGGYADAPRCPACAPGASKNLTLRSAFAATYTHSYADTSQTYYADFKSCCRIGALNNNRNAYYMVRTKVLTHHTTSSLEYPRWLGALPRLC